MHGETVRNNFADDVDAAHYPHVMDAVVVAALSQATSWSNAKRAMANMDLVYGSRFAYDEIVEGGMEKLQQALRPGGMQNRKAAILLGLLNDVKQRHGKWDLNFLFDADDDEVMKELLRYNGIGPKCAHCVMSICLSRTTFAVDTHIYRISGLWGWQPESATPQQAQAHLDARIPNALKFSIHYLLIVHGQECKHCRGGAKRTSGCETLKKIRDAMEGDE
jgi:endonuclease III